MRRIRIHAVDLLKYSTLLVLLLAVAPSAYSQVVSITASPDVINQDIGETSTITVEADAGLSNIEIHLLYDDLTLARGGFTLTETATAGTYEATLSASGLKSGSYFLRVFNLATTTYTGPTGSITLRGIATSITVQPDPFVPTGTNVATITVEGTPGQVGMTVDIQGGRSWSYCNGGYIPLTGHAQINSVGRISRIIQNIGVPMPVRLQHRYSL